MAATPLLSTGVRLAPRGGDAAAKRSIATPQERDRDVDEASSLLQEKTDGFTAACKVELGIEDAVVVVGAPPLLLNRGRTIYAPGQGGADAGGTNKASSTSDSSPTE